MTIQFDTLRYVEKLKSAGMLEAHAKASAEALSAALEQTVSLTLATKDDIRGLHADLNDVRVDTKAVINELRVAMNAEINELRVAMNTEINEVCVAMNAGHNKLQTSLDLLRSGFKSDIKVMQWMVGTIVVCAVSLVAKSFF